MEIDETPENVQLESEDGTITMISLEDAQIILREQGLDGAVHITPGTYHILTQEGLQIAEDGVTVTEGHTDGITVLQTNDTDGEDYDSSNIVTTTAGVENILFDSGAENNIDDVHGETVQECTDIPVGENNGDIAIDTGQTEDEISVKIERDEEIFVAESGENDLANDAAHLDLVQSNQPLDNANSVSKDQELNESSTINESQIENVVKPQDDGESEYFVIQNNEVGPKEKTPEEKKLDLSKPIQVTDQTIVIVNGKKCVLMANPETGQLCAYPVISSSDGKKKRRGRPRKDLSGDGPRYTPSTPQKIQSLDGQKNSGVNVPSEQANSAAEGLLELSNTGPDGIRRSGRKRQKKVLDDYEILEVSEDSGQEDDDEDDEVTPTGGVKRKKSVDQIDYTPFSPYILPGSGAKRGRGRPRRYPPPGQSNTTQIPAVVIPGANGQTIMMAPIQGLQNFQSFQEHVKSLPTATVITSKTQTIAVEGGQQLVTVSSTDTLTTDSATDVTEDIHIDTNQNSTDDGDGELEQAAASAETIMSETSLPENNGDIDTGDETQKSTSELAVVENDQQTIIQIPENLLPMFLPKKDPIKIGLKASENELEKLKCPKCNFQAFYPKQYQTHIATHTDDINKCKCCNFYTFDKEDLISHMKENHPRCICHICNFCAEHAYVIKRHMMRHNAEGCTCELCGKVYKDQYILKMHVKMVHMPAEVLFECTICLKKFTRKAHLKRHLRIHEPEKPFKCPHCDYRGCERSDISKHLLIHEEPRHVCEVCGKAFRHIKNKELHLKRHSGQRDYKCGVCDFYGYTFTDIRKHIERKHAEIKTLVCDKCGSVFKSELLLRDHQKQQCEVFMIEQALAIATSTGGMTQATLQIPSSSLTVDGQQITIDGQPIALDSGQVNITVEQVSLPEDDSITLTEEQLQASLQDGSIAVTQTHIIETDSVEEMDAIEEEVEEDGEIIQEEDIQLSATEEELSIAMV